MLSRSGLQGISDTRAIYFGDKRIDDPDKLKDIVYLNQGGMRVNLPAKSDNYGNKVPDFELIPKYEQAMKEIRNIQTTDPKAYLIREAQILKKYGLSDLVDSKGFPNKDRFGAFLVVNGQASSDAVGNPTLATTVGNMDSDFENMSKYYILMVKVALHRKLVVHLWHHLDGLIVIFIKLLFIFRQIIILQLL